MKRRNFIKQIGVAASLPLLGRAALATAAETPAKTNNGSHKILSCNVRVDVPADAKTGDSWAERKEMCADIIKAQKADLIGLQEGQAAHLDYLKLRMPDTTATRYLMRRIIFIPSTRFYFCVRVMN
jgi:hypothetical protein